MKKVIKIPIYFGELILEQHKNLKKIEKIYGMSSLSGFDAIAFRSHTKKGYNRYVMAFKKDVCHIDIAHEAVHVVNYIFKDTFIDLDINNDEPQAYLTGWVVGQCHKHLKFKTK